MPAHDTLVDRRVASGRRQFLNACVIFGASGVGSASYATAGRLLESGQALPNWKGGSLVHIRHSASAVGDPGAYFGLRKTLAACAINPWLRSWMDALDEALPVRFEVIGAVGCEGGEKSIVTLLNFSESFDPETDDSGLSFVEWLRLFRPEGRDDFIMALPLYEACRYSGRPLPLLKATEDPWLDAMLKSTRGMLFWKTQWIELVRIVGGTSQQHAGQLVQDFQRGDSDAAMALKEVRYAGTGQSLLEIVRERSPGSGPMGMPDYLAGEWLHRHWRCV